MNFDIDGNMLSGFTPPSDRDGKLLSYEEWRISVGVPTTQAEHDAIAECNKAMDIKDYKAYKIWEAKRAVAEDEAWRMADRCKNTYCINGYNCDGSHQTMEPCLIAAATWAKS